jgi:hypothetical protein
MPTENKLDTRQVLSKLYDMHRRLDILEIQLRKEISSIQNQCYQIEALFQEEKDKQLCTPEDEIIILGSKPISDISDVSSDDTIGN